MPKQRTYVELTYLGVKTLTCSVKPRKIIKTVRFQTLRSSLFAQQIKPLLPLTLFFDAEAKFIVLNWGI
jgi:hypothetical protein